MSKKNIEVTDKEEELKEVNKEGLDNNEGKEEVGRSDAKIEPNDNDPEAIISDLEDQLSQTNDKYLRLLAEFTNFRNRTQREKSDLVKTASKDVIKDLLPVIDDFERAFKADPENEANNGFQLIYNKLKTTLENLGVKAMETVGEAFDPEFHDALTKIPAPSKDLKGKVVDEIEKGYFLKGTIIRHAKVVVGK